MGICLKCNEIPKKLVPGEIQAELICLPLMVVMAGKTNNEFITPLYPGQVAEQRIRSNCFKQKGIC